MIVLVVASASLAEAVIPTTVPAIAFSVTSFVAPSTSVTLPTLNSSTSLTLIVIAAVLKLPSLDVARTVML